MPRAADAKQARMHLRLDARSKRRLARAATLTESTISEFVLSNALAAADRVIEQHELVTLPAPDWDRFYAALLHPPAPNARLKAAARRYRERVGA
jgi:uncharacterized protein (DUF1778 family)